MGFLHFDVYTRVQKEKFQKFMDVNILTCGQKGHLLNTAGVFPHMWEQKGQPQNICGVFVHMWVQKPHIHFTAGVFAL